MGNKPNTADLLSLPERYNEMQEVDNVEWNNFPDGLKHRPFMYGGKDVSGRSALVVLSGHGLGAFYNYVGGDLLSDPATVQYKRVAATYDAGCMVHAFRDIPALPEFIAATVQDQGYGNEQVVKTVHADDASIPPLILYYQTPTPICHVEKYAGKVILHCMAYLEDTRHIVDVEALGRMRFARHTNAQGGLIDWRLVVPLIAEASAPVLQYFSLEVVADEAIRSGEVVRLKMGSVTGEGEAGRSFAFVWP
ncbi:MAG: hypothetical protein KF843_14985 [Flavobacteriales bacterium]|nr:hypothetical protein [Flavobacteriales bacterium]